MLIVNHHWYDSFGGRKNKASISSTRAAYADIQPKKSSY